MKKAERKKQEKKRKKRVKRMKKQARKKLVDYSEKEILEAGREAIIEEEMHRIRFDEKKEAEKKKQFEELQKNNSVLRGLTYQQFKVMKLEGKIRKQIEDLKASGMSNQDLRDLLNNKVY